MSLPPYRVAYSPIIERPPIRWPNGARVAVWVAPNVEHYEYLPDYDDLRNPWPRTPHPDAREYSYPDYGNRVGFWRMLEVLDKHNIKACPSLNLAVLEHFPEIRDAMVERDWDYMSHGMYNTRFLHAVSEEDEREFYRDSVETLKRETGKRLKGMFGPNGSSSLHSPDLMAEAGLIYHCDWMHDDQPVPIQVKGGGKFVSVPYSIETNDGGTFRASHEGDYFAKICKAQFDQLYKEGGRERPGHVRRPAPVPDRPAPSGEVPGRAAGPHHVPRRRLADDGGRDSRVLHRQPLRRGDGVRRQPDQGRVLTCGAGASPSTSKE